LDAPVYIRREKEKSFEKEWMWRPDKNLVKKFVSLISFERKNYCFPSRRIQFSLFENSNNLNID
jgi:hypothetical protein